MIKIILVKGHKKTLCLLKTLTQVNFLNALLCIDESLKLPKNKSQFQPLMPTVYLLSTIQPKDTPMKEDGGKENLSLLPEIDPMIF